MALSSTAVPTLARAASPTPHQMAREALVDASDTRVGTFRLRRAGSSRADRGLGDECEQHGDDQNDFDPFPQDRDQRSQESGSEGADRPGFSVAPISDSTADERASTRADKFVSFESRGQIAP